MSKSRPWYPFYYEDYDRDTQDLSDAADLMYRRLLSVLWKNGGFAPLDYDWLATRLRKRPSFIRKIFEAELLKFFTVQGGEFYQKRQLEEYNRATEISQKRALSGRHQKKATDGTF